MTVTRVASGETAVVLQVADMVTLPERQGIQLHEASVNMVESLGC